MTTDNRTNEITDEQVEAAAKAINLAGWTYEGLCEPGEYCDECRKVCVEVARAALVAAANTAPQAESGDLREALGRAREHFTAIAGSGEIRVWEDTGEKLGIDSQTRGWAKRGERICREALAAQVLLSSTVDEDALAEVIREAEQSWHLSDEKSQQSYACGAPDLKSKYIARAVAARLKEQGR